MRLDRAMLNALDKWGCFASIMEHWKDVVKFRDTRINLDTQIINSHQGVLAFKQVHGAPYVHADDFVLALTTFVTQCMPARDDTTGDINFEFPSGIADDIGILTEPFELNTPPEKEAGTNQEIGKQKKRKAEKDEEAREKARRRTDALKTKEQEKAGDVLVQVENESSEDEAGEGKTTRTKKLVLDDLFIAMNAVLEDVPREQHNRLAKSHFIRA